MVYIRRKKEEITELEDEMQRRFVESQAEVVKPKPTGIPENIWYIMERTGADEEMAKQVDEQLKRLGITFDVAVEQGLIK